MIDIAARADHGHGATLHQQLASQRRRQRHRPTRLNHQLKLAEGRLHCVEDFLVGDDEARSQKTKAHEDMVGWSLQSDAATITGTVNSGIWANTNATVINNASVVPIVIQCRRMASSTAGSTGRWVQMTPPSLAAS